MNAVEFKGLTKRYGSRVGVQGLNFEVSEGALFGFLGPNGAGKTTAIRILLGLLRPDQGTATVRGLDCWRAGHRIRADVGYIPGDLRLYPSLSARETLQLFSRIRGCKVSRFTEELLADFALEPDVRVRQMSRGTRQKLGLILALAHRPRLLILDEPTTALDPIVQETLYRHLRRMATGGHTVFFSSHTLSEVENLCDRIAILRQGRLIAQESLAILRARAQRDVVIRWQTDGGNNGREVPPFLTVHERSDRQWHGSLKGSSVDLVRWSASQPIEDLSISAPDLSRLFQQYYRSETS